jgi:hypothetical protein
MASGEPNAPLLEGGGPSESAPQASQPAALGGAATPGLQGAWSFLQKHPEPALAGIERKRKQTTHQSRGPAKKAEKAEKNVDLIGVRISEHTGECFIQQRAQVGLILWCAA